MGDRLRLIRLDVVARGEVGRAEVQQHNKRMSCSVSQGVEAGSCVGVLGLWGAMQGHRQNRNTRGVERVYKRRYRKFCDALMAMRACHVLVGDGGC